MRMMPPPCNNQRGSSLIEALIAILIFSIGVLALVGLQAVSIKNSMDAHYRAEAAYLANQIIGQMWVDRANISTYMHNATGTNCTFSGGTSGATAVTNWLSGVSKLPGGSASKVQIKSSSPFTNATQITVTICWKTPQETSEHNYVATAHINI